MTKRQYKKAFRKYIDDTIIDMVILEEKIKELQTKYDWIVRVLNKEVVQFIQSKQKE